MTDILAEFERMIAGMSPEEKAEFDKNAEPELRLAWIPNPGPQTEAYFSLADLLLYGGAAGGGKTDLLLGLALNEHHRSVIFRRTYPDLRGIEDRLVEMRNNDRTGYNGADMRLKWGASRLLEMGALEKPGAEKGWQGNPHDLIGFDEGAQLSAYKVAFVMGWNRSTRPGQRKRVVIASNPPLGGDGNWLIPWFAPWLDPNHPNPAAPGELRWALTNDDQTEPMPIWMDGPDPMWRNDDGTYRLATMEDVDLNDAMAVEDHVNVFVPTSRTFIPARLHDNPYLRGTGYLSKLQAMPEPLRTQLMKGDFMAGREDHDLQVIPSDWVDLANERWEKKGRPKGQPMLTIGADVAQGGKDWTVLAPLYGVWYDYLIRAQGVKTKDGTAVGSMIVQHMRDGATPIIDMGGGWGGGAMTFLKGNDIHAIGFIPSGGSTKRTRDKKLGFLNQRAEMWWSFREDLDPSQNNPDEMPAFPADARLKAQLTTPRWKLKGVAIQVEMKADIKKRLEGQSTDDADALLQAWHGRGGAVARQARKAAAKKSGGQRAMHDYDPLREF